MKLYDISVPIFPGMHTYPGDVEMVLEPVAQRVQALREQYPRWGRKKLRVLLAREGVILSAKSIDRVIHRL